MRAFLQRGFRGVLVASLTLSLGLGPVGADTLKQKIVAAEADLTEATQEVTDAQTSLAQAQQKLPGARAALTAANQDKSAAQAVESTARAKYETATANLSSAQAQLTAARDAIIAIQGKIRELQTKVDLFARSVYQQGPASQLEIVLESESPTDLSSRLQAIKSVAQASNASLNDLDIAKAALRVQVDKAKVLTDKMQGLADDAANTLADAETATGQATAAADRAYNAQVAVDALVAQQNHALAVAKRFKVQTQRRYDRLIAEQIAISRISNSGSHGDGDPAGTSALIPLWPVPGYAAGSDPVQHIGPRILSDGRHSCHTGQDIPAPTGAEIVSPGPGVVLFAGWNWGYGNLTMIDHGSGLVTAYAHQSRILVSKGDLVTSGEHIGDVGNTGAFSRGAHLHFEVHVNGYNYDPMGWYGGSKTLVACAPTRGF